MSPEHNPTRAGERVGDYVAAEVEGFLYWDYRPVKGLYHVGSGTEIPDDVRIAVVDSDSASNWVKLSSTAPSHFVLVLPNLGIRVRADTIQYFNGEACSISHELSVSGTKVDFFSLGSAHWSVLAIGQSGVTTPQVVLR